PETLCFPHFGPREATEAVLSGYKRTLVEWVEAVREKRDTHDTDEEVVEAFAESVDTDLIDVWGETKARAEERLNARGVLGYLDAREE
ncbi:MAG: MBL fold metallo-hydrolase, partial [Halobaculum sp.]